MPRDRGRVLVHRGESVRHRDGHRARRRPPNALSSEAPPAPPRPSPRRHRRPSTPSPRRTSRRDRPRGPARLGTCSRTPRTPPRRTRNSSPRVASRSAPRARSSRPSRPVAPPPPRTITVTQRARVQPRVRGGIVQRREVRDEREARALRLLRGVRWPRFELRHRSGSVAWPTVPALAPTRPRRRVRFDVLLVERRASGAVQPRHGRREFRAVLACARFPARLHAPASAYARRHREKSAGHRRRGRVRRDGHL